MICVNLFLFGEVVLGIDGAFLNASFSRTTLFTFVPWPLKHAGVDNIPGLISDYRRPKVIQLYPSGQESILSYASQLN